MAVHVLSPGLLATVQDAGRFGSRAIGVAVSGAADSFALRAANVLVGNAPGEAALELTLTGASLRFESDALVALCGAAMDARAEGGPPLALWRPCYVRSGTVLRIGAARAGVRAYLAVAGGFAVPAVLASRSTHARARLGGFAGRPLAPGDRLPLGALPRRSAALMAWLAARAAASDKLLAAAPWALAEGAKPPYAEHPAVRAVRGREAERFETAGLEAFFGAPYRLSPQSDRMGCRLEGPRLALQEPLEMLSEAVVPGTVQVPPDGQPIVLLADAQTTGGYPRIAQVAAVDLPLVAQARPGARLRFIEITHREAERLYLEREQLLVSLAASVDLRIKSL
ncbi:biotin-dependent carboxyltransferase family protein [Paenibacillus sp. YYML68]|uniref:5-oxoprolinase subunit C family protein n=1 Tax=Paenibacillus sp. YYML68 TaxID=2909250 RepID=UPI002492AB96|nr:biotin-dependent carboxyltransferase family protein [Paenibacillus sp. YYML68]